MRIFLQTSFSIALALAAASRVQAAQVSMNVALQQQGNDWIAAVSPFDTSLGVLNSTQWSASLNELVGETIYNNGPYGTYFATFSGASFHGSYSSGTMTTDLGSKTVDISTSGGIPAYTSLMLMTFASENNFNGGISNDVALAGQQIVFSFVSYTPYLAVSGGYEGPGTGFFGYVNGISNFFGSVQVNYNYTPSQSIDAPEPASWMMMIGGFSLIGSAMRSRKKRASALSGTMRIK